MSLEELAAARRTHKSFGPEPVSRSTLFELLEVAHFAPTHHLNQPWRFRVLGPETLEALKRVAGEKEAQKLDRAPTLVVASAKLSGDMLTDEEDLHATACAVYIVLLAAHARGLAGYWRTPRILLTPAGREAAGLEDGERFVALIHLGAPTGDRPAREREPVHAFVEYLD